MVNGAGGLVVKKNYLQKGKPHHIDRDEEEAGKEFYGGAVAAGSWILYQI